MNKSLRCLFLVGAFLSGFATAGVIDWNSLGAPTGDTSTVSGIGLVKANGGNFMSKGRFDQQGNYWNGFGLSNRPAGEIGQGESISIEFFSPRVIESFSLGFLWPKDTNMKDSVNERAVVSVYYSDGTIFDYFLQATSWNTATWTGLGSVANLSPADMYPNAAVWNVKNPFSNSAVSKLVFEPSNSGFATGKDSDFSIMAVNVVSEPNPFILFMGFLGFIILSRPLFIRK